MVVLQACAFAAPAMPIVRAKIMRYFFILLLDLVVDFLLFLFSFVCFLFCFTHCCLITLLIEHHLISRLQMYLDGTHLLCDILACSLYHSLTQVGGELCPRIGGDIDAASE